MPAKNAVVFFIVSFLCSTLSAQPFSSYVNPKNEFYTFDGSTNTVQQLDYLQPFKYKTGGNCIAFIDNTKSFKVFQYGRVSKLNDGYTTDFDVSRDLLLMKNQASAYVYDGGLLMLLSAYSSSTAIGDSIIGFFDDRNLAYKMYYNGRIYKLEENTVEFPVKQYAIGSNIFAYTNNNDDFKIWYHGEVIEQESQAPSSMLAGKNIVAYTDREGTFKIFYKGETQEMESFAPKAVRVGDDFVAYLDNLSELKIFYAGKVYETNVLHPTYFSSKYNLVVFENGSGGLNVFYKGNITTLENYVPDNIQLGDNTLFYFDQSKQVKVFSFGTQETLPNELYESALIDYDVIQLKTGFNQYHFYYKGKIY